MPAHAHAPLHHAALLLAATLGGVGCAPVAPKETGDRAAPDSADTDGADTDGADTDGADTSRADTDSADAGVAFDLEQTLSDGAQRRTLGFAALAMVTGNLQAQSFFPPGKVADYTGFQYLRDNDPDGMGHNTSFLTRVANDVIYVLDDEQLARLVALAEAEQDEVDRYAYQRYPLMKAFRRLLEGDLPAGSTGLDPIAVAAASRELYRIDGQIAFDRALAYAEILASLDATQRAWLDAMKGLGWSSWPEVDEDEIDARLAGLPGDAAGALRTYAGDLFSWYAGSVEADVYFCPERHGTYYGSFYLKDAPAVGVEGYSIDEELTATAGGALVDPDEGYVSEAQAALVSDLVDSQRDNLYASPDASIVGLRTEIATLLRGLLESTADADAVEEAVLARSATYGELDGEDQVAVAAAFAALDQSLSDEQRSALAALRATILTGTRSDGTAYDYTVATDYYLYSTVIDDTSALDPYLADTDALFLPSSAEPRE